MATVKQAHIADLGLPRVVVVGGGFGGMSLVKSLKNIPVQVVLFDKNNHHTFQPLLYQVATSGLESSNIIFPFRMQFANQNRFYFRLGELKQVVAEENYIDSSIGRIHYDYLVIATGASTNFYGMEDIAKHAVAIKTVADAIAVRNQIIQNMEHAVLTDNDETMNSLMDFVIVGGGATGVELAGALAELKKSGFTKDYNELNMREMDVHLIEAGPKLLGNMSEKASDTTFRYLKKMGVNIQLGVSVESYDGYRVVFNNNTSLITKTLIWAAGVKGNIIPGLHQESIGKGNRIKVNQYNCVEGYENIFAIGDVALMTGDVSSPKGHPMMAPPATQQGHLLAQNVGRILQQKEMKAFRYKNRGMMATIGKNKAVADLKAFHAKGIFAWVIWMFIHLASITGFKNKVWVFFSWLWSYFFNDKINRIIIEPTSSKQR